MMRLLILFLFLHQLCFTQNGEKIYIEDGGFQCVENVSKKIYSAVKNGEHADFHKYLNIIRKNCIEGKYLRSHAFETIDKNLVLTDSITKPMILWISGVESEKNERSVHLKNTDQGIIDALFTTYGDDLQIIVISRDKRNAIKKRRSMYDPSVPVVPYDKLVGEKKYLYVDGFKHFFIYPAMYIIDTDKRITGFKTGHVFISDSITSEQAIEKSIQLYKKAIESGFRITQDGVGQIKLGDETEGHFDSDAIQEIPNSEGKIKSITVKSKVYVDSNEYSVGSNIDSIAQNYATTIKEMRMKKGSRLLGSLGNAVHNGNIIYLDIDKNGSVDWIHLEQFMD